MRYGRTVQSFPCGWSRPVRSPSRSRGGQIFTNPRRTGRLVVSPRVTPPRKRPVHVLGSFRSRGGRVRLDPPPSNPSGERLHPGSSPASFSFSSGRFLSTWQGSGRSHPHFRGGCARHTHPFGENPSRSVPSRSKGRHVRADVLAHQPAKAPSAKKTHNKRVSSERKNEAKGHEGAKPRLRKERRGKVEERETDRRFRRRKIGRKAKRVVV